MAHFNPQGLLLLVLLTAISECIEIETVSATQEEDVGLPCFDSNPENCDRVRWINVTDARVILARPETPLFQDAKRVKWEADGNGQMSLFLTKLQKSDEGQYRCEIWRGWDCILVKNISLKVKECKTLQAVKAAPSTPVNLDCPVEVASGQQGPQDISWAMLKGGNPQPVNSKRVEMNGTSFAIQSVNHTDNGWYRCKYTLGQTQSCFDIHLLVQEVGNDVVAATVQALTTSEIVRETRTEGSSGTVIAVVASVIIGIAIISALIGLLIHRRLNTQRITQPTHPPGTVIDSAGGYEIVNLMSSEDRTNQRVNSLYQQLPDETLCTFHY